MTWRDKSGVRWNARRPNGWPNDDKAPDGFTVAGYRRIDGKGRVRFDGGYWTNERFTDMVGRFVLVHFRNWPSTVVAAIGAPDTNPNNLFEDGRHSSFYEWRNEVVLTCVGDWRTSPDPQAAAVPA